LEHRPDYAKKPDSFFNSLKGHQALLARELRRMIHQALPHVSESLKWGMPVYEQDKLICSIRPAKEFVALQFYQSGTSLSDPDGLLEGMGKKMRHIKIRSKKDIRKRLFIKWIKQAAE